MKQLLQKLGSKNGKVFMMILVVIKMTTQRSKQVVIDDIFGGNTEVGTIVIRTFNILVAVISLLFIYQVIVSQRNTDS